VKSIDSQFSEAVMFYKQKNYTEAIKIWRSLADGGDSDSQYNLGQAYDNGEGVVKDPAQSALWYSKAAKQGDAAAQYNLGVDYLKGDGVTKDYDVGIKWITLAAKQGYPDALAVMKEQAATNARASAPARPHCHFLGVESPAKYALSDGQCVNADGTASASPVSHTESVSPICRQLGDMLERIANYSIGNDYAKERQTETIKRNMDQLGCSTEPQQAESALSDERKLYLYNLCKYHTDRNDCDVYQ
jgi:TPR repeat protein